MMLRVRPLSVMVALMLGPLGCFGNQDESVGAGSGLSQVDIATPTAQDFAKVYGENCANVTLTDEAKAKVGGKVGCEAVLALTNDYQLTIDGGACAGGQTGTNLPATTGKLNSQSIAAKLKRNCDYSVKLELGLDGTYYFDNANSYQGNLNRSQVAGETSQLTIKLRPTAAGLQLGFPQGSEVEPTGFTKLKIEVDFGSGTGNQSRDGVEVVAPAGWNGSNFLGDNLFNLRRAN